MESVRMVCITLLTSVVIDHMLGSPYLFLNDIDLSQKENKIKQQQQIFPLGEMFSLLKVFEKLLASRW